MFSFKAFFIFLFSLFSTSSFALVEINKGPAFALQRSKKPISQDQLIGLYLAWDALSGNPLKSFQLKADIKVKTLLNPESSRKLLKPANLTENQLSFGYKSGPGLYYSWNFVETNYGYCHGMTMVTRQFVYLAKFKPEIKLKMKYSYLKNPKYWMEYYKRKIDSVMNGKSTEIPGFNNLSELSNSPMKNYLRRHVADQWALQTARVDMLLNVQEKTFKQLTPKKFKGYFDTIKSYLSKGFYPRIILGYPYYDNSDPHVVMITNIGPIDKYNCFDLKFFDVGQSAGGAMKDIRLCDEYYAWMPDDSFYFKDISLNVK